MPAPKGNRNRALAGSARLMQIRLDDESDFDFIIEALDPTERGRALLEAAYAVARSAMIVVGDCANCGEPLTANETGTLCMSCRDLETAARAARRMRNASVSIADAILFGFKLGFSCAGA